MRIGEVATQAGVNIQTLRYYEHLRLLKEPHRRKSGHREYTKETVGEVRFIKALQELGFSLKEVEEFIQSFGGNPCQTAYEFAASKLQIVEEKLQSLSALKASLESLMASCVPSPLTGECGECSELPETEAED